MNDIQAPSVTGAARSKPWDGKSIGHSGQELTAGPGTAALYLPVVASVLARLAGGVLPEHAMALWPLAGLLWCSGFAGFVLLYGRLLICSTPGWPPPGNPLPRAQSAAAAHNQS